MGNTNGKNKNMDIEKLHKELRIGNLLFDRDNNICQVIELGKGAIYAPVISKYPIAKLPNKQIWLTKEILEKYVDWSFESGFNKSVKEEKYNTVYSYLMENSIEGSSDFEIRFIEDRSLQNNNSIVYLCDGKFINFGLDDTFHNLQNLFFVISGQELPIKH